MTRNTILLGKGRLGNDCNPKATLFTFPTKEKQATAWDDLKIKYKAVEKPFIQTTGYFGDQGLFKVAEGRCKHGTRVILEQNVPNNSSSPSPLRKG
ncbi:MAG: hypothetical protein H0W64_03400 [Gammaproteobacteria bacterium]|nr:hypothetical protein [Gammaproteobacteria bacterium]